MSNKGLETPNKEIILSSDQLVKALPGFVKATFQQHHDGQLAKSLASGFLKFMAEGRELAEADSVQSFIALSDLHRDLTEQARAFLMDEVPFVYEDQQIQPLLVKFADYRLRQVSRRYYFATLQNQPKAILDDLKAVVQQRQDEYDAVVASL